MPPAASGLTFELAFSLRAEAYVNGVADLVDFVYAPRLPKGLDGLRKLGDGVAYTHVPDRMLSDTVSIVRSGVQNISTLYLERVDVSRRRLSNLSPAPSRVVLIPRSYPVFLRQIRLLVQQRKTNQGLKIYGLSVKGETWGKLPDRDNTVCSAGSHHTYCTSARFAPASGRDARARADTPSHLAPRDPHQIARQAAIAAHTWNAACARCAWETRSTKRQRLDSHNVVAVRRWSAPQGTG